MDFSFTDEQHAIADLAKQIFTDHCTLERLKAIETSSDRYDTELWAACAKAGLLGAALPELAGGTGGGLVEICLILEQQGRRVAPLPLVASVVSAAMPLARFGSAAQQERFLPGFLDGTVLLSAALTELGADSRTPIAIAQPDGHGWRLTGVKVGVPVATLAAIVLVPARTPDGQRGVFLVDPSAPGIQLAAQEPTNWEPQARVELRGVLSASVRS